MRKLWLIFKREYLIRVRKKSFILVTILMPLFVAGIGVASGMIAAIGAKQEKRILVKDESGIFENSTTGKENFIIDFSDEPLAALKESYKENGYDILVDIPPFDDLQSREHRVNYYTEEKPSIVLLRRIEDVIGDAFREYKIDQSTIDKSILESFQTNISMDQISSSSDEPETRDSGKLAAVIGTVLGVIMGVVMYMVLLIYGQMVMRSVMEEKISRIVEVMISSVRPFQLMMGKITGVAAVGLTQIAIWVILIPIALTVVQFFVPGMDSGGMQDINGELQRAQQEAGGVDLSVILDEFFQMNWLMIIPAYIFFFLGGYLIYSSLFAAIGSAVNEDLGEAQQLMLPVMLPIIFAFIIMMSSIENPNGSLSVFGSIFPFTSPIIMPARLPFEPPWWHIALSMALLLLTTLFIIWVSARIYRIGILMYGKKVTFKEMGKWLFYR